MADTVDTTSGAEKKATTTKSNKRRFSRSDPLKKLLKKAREAGLAPGKRKTGIVQRAKGVVKKAVTRTKRTTGEKESSSIDP